LLEATSGFSKASIRRRHWGHSFKCVFIAAIRPWSKSSAMNESRLDLTSLQAIPSEWGCDSVDGSARNGSSDPTSRTAAKGTTTRATFFRLRRDRIRLASPFNEPGVTGSQSAAAKICWRTIDAVAHLVNVGTPSSEILCGHHHCHPFMIAFFPVVALCCASHSGPSWLKN